MIIASAVFAALVAGSQAPHWIDVLPLTDPVREEHVADAAFLGNETISDGIAWSCPTGRSLRALQLEPG